MVEYARAMAIHERESRIGKRPAARHPCGGRGTRRILRRADRGGSGTELAEHEIRRRRAVPGLSAKIRNERLRKLCDFGVLEHRVYAEVPPRVEHRLTSFGAAFVDILDRIAMLAETVKTMPVHARETPRKTAEQS